MRINRHAKDLANDLGLSDAEAAVMELKAWLYKRASQSILKSKFTHQEIAQQMGTSRARITRIANLGENSLSIEVLFKIIVLLEKKVPLRVA